MNGCCEKLCSTKPLLLAKLKANIVSNNNGDWNNNNNKKKTKLYAKVRTHTEILKKKNSQRVNINNKKEIEITKF